MLLCRKNVYVHTSDKAKTTPSSNFKLYQSLLSRKYCKNQAKGLIFLSHKPYNYPFGQGGTFPLCDAALTPFCAHLLNYLILQKGPKINVTTGLNVYCFLALSGLIGFSFDKAKCGLLTIAYKKTK